MGKAVLVDEKSLLVETEGVLRQVPLEEVGDCLVEPTDVAVLPCHVARLVAVSEERLEQLAVEEAPQHTTFCYQRLHGQVYQVFGMSEALLRVLRAVPWVRAVVPYGVAVRDARLARPQTLKRTSRVKRSKGGDLEREHTDVAVVDVLAESVVVTVLRRGEICSVRVLPPNGDLKRELFVTLQGASAPDCVLETHSERLAERLWENNVAIDVVDPPEGALALGLAGLGPTTALQFLLPAEKAARRRRVLRYKNIRSACVTGVIFAASLVVLFAASSATSKAERKLLKMEEERLRREQQQLASLYHNRYAGLMASRVVDLPQAWAELELIMPHQLEVVRVSVAPGVLRAKLRRRRVSHSAMVGAPVALGDLRQAVRKSENWRGADIKLVFESHEIGYELEDRRGS